jgi:hypothetical protein
MITKKNFTLQSMVDRLDKTNCMKINIKKQFKDIDKNLLEQITKSLLIDNQNYQNFIINDKTYILINRQLLISWLDEYVYNYADSDNIRNFINNDLAYFIDNKKLNEYIMNNTSIYNAFSIISEFRCNGQDWCIVNE